MLLFLTGLACGVLLIIITIKTLINAGRYVWKYAAGLLLMLVLGVWLLGEAVISERRYHEYLHKTGSTHMYKVERE